MLLNIGLGALIFGYAGYSLFRFYRKSKEGKCGGCAIKDGCQKVCPSNDKS